MKSKNIFFLFILFFVCIISIKGVEGVTSPYDNKYSYYNYQVPQGTDSSQGLIYNSSSNSFYANGLSTQYNKIDLYQPIIFSGMTIHFSIKYASNDYADAPNLGLFTIDNSSTQLTYAYIRRNSSTATYGRIYFDLKNASFSQNFPSSASGTFVNLTTQTNITMVYSATSVKLYINGVLNQTITNGANGGLAPMNITRIFVMTGNGQYFNGTNYNFYLWNDTLNDTEVSLVNNGTIPKLNNLVGGYNYTSDGCFIPSNNFSYVASSNIDVCNGIYSNFTFITRANNTYFNCNQSIFNQPNTTFYNNQYYNNGFQLKNCYINNTLSSNTLGGIGYINSRADNVVIINSTILGFETNVQLGDNPSNRMLNFTIFNSNISNSNGCLANVMQYGGQTNYINSHFDNSVNITTCSAPPHGIYISTTNTQSDVNGTYILNSTFNNNINNRGIHFNRLGAGYIYNVSIINSTFANDNTGMDLYGCYNCLVSGNTFINNRYGLEVTNTDNSSMDHIYSTTNTQIVNNNFSNIVSDVRVWYSVDNTLLNNSYSLKNYTGNVYASNIEVRNATFSFTMNDNVMPNFRINMFPINALVGFYTGYVGKFNALITNNASYNLLNISIFNQLSQYPFNDIKNSSNNVILSSNVDSYSVLLSPNQQIEVGDFGDCIEGSVFPCTVISSPPYDYATTKTCQDTRTSVINALSEFPQWITLALILIAVGVIITIIVSNMKDSRDFGMDSNFDLNNIFVVIIPVILTAIFIVLGIIILSNLC